MNDLRIEIRAVTDQIAGDHAHAARPKLPRQIAELGCRIGVADSDLGGVGVVAPLGKGRVAATVEDEITLQDTIADWSRTEQRRCGGEVRSEQGIRHYADHELRIAGGDEQSIRVAAIQQMSVEVTDRHAPQQVLETRGVEALVETCSQCLCSGRRTHREEQRDHHACCLSHRLLVDLPRHSRDPSQGLPARRRVRERGCFPESPEGRACRSPSAQRGRYPARRRSFRSGWIR